MDSRELLTSLPAAVVTHADPADAARIAGALGWQAPPPKSSTKRRRCSSGKSRSHL
jgi:hypothetical protein